MKPRRSPGFTLLEVLIALAIFAMAAVVLAGAYINVLSGYEVAKRATVSQPELRFARAQLLAQPDIELARQGGDFDSADGRRVRWTAQIEPTGQADLFEVTFECEVAGSGSVKEQTTRQLFRVLRPTWSVAADRTTLRAASKERILKIMEGVNQ
ncbi:MAG: prepilin-type N-terminal cleavage/methylation domain-containing protein [Rariglobus sp.]